ADSVALVGERRVNIMDAVQGGETAILNTAEHLLRVNPSAEEYREATMQILKQKAQDRYVESKVGDQVFTRDGVMLSVMANLDRHEEASRLPGKSLAGIALYRTENEYEGRDAISEKEWVSIFTSVLRDSGVEVLSIRLPDRQKSVRGKDIKDSKAFGSGRLDGIKFLLNDPIGRDIAGTVLRAAIRVSNQGAKIRVFFPMIVTVGEWRQARKLFDEASEVLIDKRIITEEDAARVSVGLMFETPEAIVSSRVLMQNADFGSIGTNDLIARLQDEPMERDASEISAKYTQLTPELLNYLDLLVHNARKLDKPFPLSLCGMLASSPESLLYFAYAKADRGIEIIPSVGAGEAAYVKEFIRHIDTGNLTRIFTSPEIRTNAKALRAALAVEIERIDNEIVRESDEILRAMVDLSLETYERNSSLSEMKTVIARSTDIDQSI
ncbi:MAG: hypothetical protein PHO30_00945, partial [Candidatus Omnitrophica bacterium]|nr:hypothetical protein [Candidatus Omnitrophota bacterium]